MKIKVSKGDKSVEVEFGSVYTDENTKEADMAVIMTKALFDAMEDDCGVRVRLKVSDSGNETTFFHAEATCFERIREAVRDALGQ